jgi:hypothetical protein
MICIGFGAKLNSILIPFNPFDYFWQPVQFHLSTCNTLIMEVFQVPRAVLSHKLKSMKHIPS